MPPTSTRGTKLRYRWSHRHPVHRALVRTANRALPRIPFSVKYALTDAIRGRSLPYRLLASGTVAVQVGAPLDTLRSGRSRAMAFVRMTRPGGRVLVVEPDEQSASAFRSAADEHGMSHATVVCAAAWDERTKLVLERDPGHPATNFTAGTADYAHDDLARFEAVEVDAVPVDDLLEEHGFGRVDIVSVTTNGAEARILNGLRRTIKRDRPVICLARTEDSYDELMTGLGYELAGDDDRGFTFVSRTARS